VKAGGDQRLWLVREISIVRNMDAQSVRSAYWGYGVPKKLRCTKMHLEVLLHEEKRFHRPLADNLAVHDTVAIALAQQHIFLCLAVDSPRNIR
jgi:Holliday junction resolvasome RuvABC endonuclease subunit